MHILSNLFGGIMNVLCQGLSVFGIVSVPAGIILFAIVVTILLLPISIGQLKFSMAKVKMAPKMQAIHDKYAMKEEMTEEDVKKQTEEINAVYKDAGVSPSGKVIGFIIQFLLLIAMYQVAGNVTTYVPMFRNASQGAFTFFTRDVSDLPLTVLQNGFDLTTVLVLVIIFLTMLPFGFLKQKNYSFFIRGSIMAVLFTAIALKVPMGLCIYWAAKSFMSLIMTPILTVFLKKKYA
jgi:YidC/Oxa1 family membrane protein insertase